MLSPWVLMTISVATGLWGVSKDGPSSVSVWPLAGAAGGAVFFAAASSGRAKEATPFAAFTVLVALVSYFSSGHGGADSMMNWYERYGLTEAQAHLLTLAFRKTVHFTFYGTVGVTASWVARASGAERVEVARTALLAALAVASFDELRQAAYANRSGSAWDVALDLAGAAAFLGLSEWRRRKGR